MAMLVIQTQVLENYAFDDEGNSMTPGYWKPKGGNEYRVLNVDLTVNFPVFVQRIRPQVERDDDCFREFVIDWFVESDDYLDTADYEVLQVAAI